VARGYPPSRYEWFKKSKTSNLVSRFSHDGKFQSLDGTLLISNPTIFDSDYYTCIVTNSQGSARCEIKLLVYSPLKVNINPFGDQTLVNSGSSIRLNCTVYGYPVNEVKWLKNGRVIKEYQNDNKNLQQVQDEHSLSLDITMIEKKHIAMYQCFASNNLESSQQTTQLVLNGNYYQMLKMIKL
jgi:netrin receptor DCC